MVIGENLALEWFVFIRRTIATLAVCQRVSKNGEKKTLTSSQKLLKLAMKSSGLFSLSYSRDTVKVFRSNDRGIRHIWHEAVCPTIESTKKREMCYRTAYGNYASLQTLSTIFKERK